MTTTSLPLIADATLTASDAGYYTCPANTSAVIKRAVFTNTSGSAVTITVNIVRAGGSSSTENQIISSRPIAPLDTHLPPELVGLALNAGDAVHALAGTASVVNLMASGIQIV